MHYIAIFRHFAPICGSLLLIYQDANAYEISRDYQHEKLYGKDKICTAYQKIPFEIKMLLRFSFAMDRVIFIS